MADPVVIQAEEYEELRLGDAPGQITPAQWQEVERSWSRTTSVSLSKCFEFGARTVMPKNWIGTVGSPDLVLEVLPRGAKRLSQGAQTLLSRNLDQMLRIALSDRRIELADAALASSGSRFEPAVEMLADLVLLARRKRVIRAYRAQEEVTRTFRGRLLFPAQSLAELRQPGNFAAARVELHEETPENRFLKGVMARLHQRVAGRVRRRLDEALSHFDAVTTFSEPWIDYDRIRFDRLTVEYASAVELAKGLLEGEIGGLLSGSTRSRSEIVYTPELFERFVVRLADAVGPETGCSVASKVPGRYLGRWTRGPFLGKGCFQILPDVELTRGDQRPSAVIDVKWKWLDISAPTLGVQVDDIYQVSVYGARLGCRSAALVYPWLGPESPLTGQTARAFEALGNLLPLKVQLLALPLLWSDLQPIQAQFADAVTQLLN